MAMGSRSREQAPLRAKVSPTGPPSCSQEHRICDWSGESAAAADGTTSVAFALVFLGLALWRMWAGAFRKGLQELDAGARTILEVVGWNRSARPGQTGGRSTLVIFGILVLATASLATGFVRVPPEARAYGFVFGRLSMPDAQPGLHWVPPWPIGVTEVQPVGQLRKVDVGFRSDPGMLARRRMLT